MSERELEREREVVEALYARLDEQRDEAARRLSKVRAERVGGNHQARSERDAFARLHEDRLAELREVDARLVFGRLLLERGADAGGAVDAPSAPDAPRAAVHAASTAGTEAPPAASTPERLTRPELRYIGRIGLRDAEQRAMLLDWRAPQAAAFYRATAAEPLGVRARRHLALAGRELVRIDDEVFDDTLLGGDETVQGEGALLAAITARRGGRMRDIVATIQGEQDRIIRSELRGALVVQGGPGTGKTAVALHRAAYLAYANRERLGRSGILVVGPSDAFLQYVEAVLPSLGETGVVMRSLGELYPGVDAAAEDPPAVARLKGSRRMAALLARAVKARRIVPDGPRTIEVDGERLTVRPELIRTAMQKAERRGKPHNVARVTFVKHALDALTERLAAQLVKGGATVDDADRKVLREDLRTAYDVRVLLNTAWLPLSPEKLLGDLYARPAWLAELTRDWREEDRALLARERRAPFTVSDVPLLDEAAELLGEMPDDRQAARAAADRAQHGRDLEHARAAIADAGAEGVVDAERLVAGFAGGGDGRTTAERAAADRGWTYGHIVVDEAQELSYMQWRLLVRRCPLRSFTIVGDIAQASSAASARSWRQALDPHFRQWRQERLTVNYRTPARITRVAERFAAAEGLAITPTESVREGEHPVARVDAAGADLVPALLALLADDPRADAGIAAEEAGTLAVIAPAADADRVAAALAEALGTVAVGTVAVGRGSAGLGRPIAVLAPDEAKGLEFDEVVIVDAARILAGAARGVSALYVAATRATQRLTLLGPAPAALAEP
nr:AAA family ATPase [Agromyces archimandritae]